MSVYIAAVLLAALAGWLIRGAVEHHRQENEIATRVQLVIAGLQAARACERERRRL